MTDAAVVVLAYCIGITGFWRISSQHHNHSTLGRIAFAALWPFSFIGLLLGTAKPKGSE